jgi:hypothetical protein
MQQYVSPNVFQPTYFSYVRLGCGSPRGGNRPDALKQFPAKQSSRRPQSAHAALQRIASDAAAGGHGNLMPSYLINTLIPS